MAKKNEILLGISLDGDSEVKRKLTEVGEHGKRSLENIDSKLKGGGGKKAFSELEESAAALRTALAPLSQATGIGGLLGGGLLGGLFSKLTSPAGIIGSIGAAVTAALVELAKLGEGTERAKGRLAALGDNKGFERITQQAKQLGTTASTLQPAAESFDVFSQRQRAKNTSIIHPPGFQPGALEDAAAGVQILGGGGIETPPSRETNAKFDNALFKQIRRDVSSNEEAARIRDQFKQSLFAGGLTPDLLRSLPPNAAKFLTSQLQRPLGQGFENPEVLASLLEQGRIRPADVSANRVINAGARPNEEFDKAAAATRNFTQAVEALQAAIGRRIEQLGGDHAGIGPKLDSAARGIDNFQPPDAKLVQGLFDNLNPVAVFGSLFSKLGGVFSSPSPPPTPQDVSGFTDGRRYSRQLNPTPVADEVAEAGKSLAAAITEAANAVRAATPSGDNTQAVPGRAGGGGIDITGGGYLRGPGTTTSDSIPVAKVSNKEYVINAAGTAKAGLAYLDWINAGMPGGGFAEGGTVIPGLRNTALPSGNYDVVPTDDGGAIINGVAYPPGSPILETPEIKQALARAQAARGSGEGRRTHKSDFVGLFGGHNFDTPGSYAKGGSTGGHIRRGYFGGGSVDIDPYIFAGGAMAGIADIHGPAPNLSGLKDSPAGWPDVDHLGSMDLHHPGGSARVFGPKQALKSMVTAARDHADVSMGSPSWLYGR